MNNHHQNTYIKIFKFTYKNAINQLIPFIHFLGFKDCNMHLVVGRIVCIDICDLWLIQKYIY